MTHQPLSPQELQEMKSYSSKHSMWTPLTIEHEGLAIEYRMAPVEEAVIMARAARDLPRCIAEIEHLRSALQRIYDDGVPYAWPIAAVALDITPPPMP